MEGPELEKDTPPCAAVRQVVYEFLDEELPPADVARVLRHLGLCPPCSGFFSFERAYLLVVKRKTSIESAPAELRERIRAALASRERPGPAN